MIIKKFSDFPLVASVGSNALFLVEQSGVFRSIAKTGVTDGSLSINAQTASYSLLLADNGALVTVNTSGVSFVYVPLNASVAFPIGSRVDVAALGAGQVSISGVAGVTVNSADGEKKLRTQYSMASAVKIATDRWLLVGDLTS